MKAQNNYDLFHMESSFNGKALRNKEKKANPKYTTFFSPNTTPGETFVQKGTQMHPRKQRRLGCGSL